MHRSRRGVLLRRWHRGRRPDESSEVGVARVVVTAAVVAVGMCLGPLPMTLPMHVRETLLGLLLLVHQKDTRPEKKSSWTAPGDGGDETEGRNANSSPEDQDRSTCSSSSRRILMMMPALLCRPPSQCNGGGSALALAHPIPSFAWRQHYHILKRMAT